MISKESKSKTLTSNPTFLSGVAINYLNAQPLVYSLQQKTIPHNFRIQMNVPGRCAELLAISSVDFGLIPVIEYPKFASGYTIVPNISISTLHRVGSVKLYSHVPIESISHVALDTDSRSSAALAQIILRKKYGIHPTFQRFSPNSILSAPTEFESFVLIGDKVLSNGKLTKYEYDLGGEWTDWKKLPFVFAVWVLRKFSADEINQILLQAKEDGIRRISKIASSWSRTKRLGNSKRIEAYLTENLNYDLTPAHINGIQMFFREAIDLDLLPSASDF